MLSHARTGLRVLGAAAGDGLRCSRVICCCLASTDSEGPDLGIRRRCGCNGRKTHCQQEAISAMARHDTVPRHPSVACDLSLRTQLRSVRSMVLSVCEALEHNIDRWHELWSTPGVSRRSSRGSASLMALSLALSLTNADKGPVADRPDTACHEFGSSLVAKRTSRIDAAGAQRCGTPPR